MGSGSRFKFHFIPNMFGIFIHVDDFPFEHTVGLHLFWWSIQIGIGKGYDE
jgi:hypothetical protein